MQEALWPWFELFHLMRGGCGWGFWSLWLWLLGDRLGDRTLQLFLLRCWFHICWWRSGFIIFSRADVDRAPVGEEQASKMTEEQKKTSWKAAEVILSVVASVFVTDGGQTLLASLYHCHSVFTYILNILKKDSEGLITTRTKVLHHLVTMNDFTKIYLSPCRRDKWTCWSAAQGFRHHPTNICQDIFTEDWSGKTLSEPCC